MVGRYSVYTIERERVAFRLIAVQTQVERFSEADSIGKRGESVTFRVLVMEETSNAVRPTRVERKNRRGRGWGLPS